MCNLNLSLRTALAKKVRQAVGGQLTVEPVWELGPTTALPVLVAPNGVVIDFGRSEINVYNHPGLTCGLHIRYNEPNTIQTIVNYIKS